MVALESMFHPPPDVDARVELDGVGWADYERLVAVRGEASVPRLTYLEGRLELMSPGRSHESDKKKLARLLEAYADHLGLALEGLGSWTVKREEVRRGAEADECYVLGPVTDAHVHPDFAIEVVYTSGGISKLDVWGGLGVDEVWFWSGERLAIFHRAGATWSPAARSRYVPAIDPALIARSMGEPSQVAAVKALRAALAA